MYTIFRKTFGGLKEGNIHTRPLYAETLKKIATDEHTLYKGTLAKEIIKELKKQGSNMTEKDLENYEYAINSYI